MDIINESDCCGNGCANCVLNIKSLISHKADKSGKRNILNKYTKFCLINKTLLLPHVLELHFKSIQCNNKDFILDINPGYHLMMRKTYTEMEKKRNGEYEMVNERKYLLRPYSPYWWDVMEMEFKILVHIIPKGSMSEYINELQINDEVEFRGSIGTFDYEEDLKGEKCLLIICQGVAISPTIPIIEKILNNEDDMTKIIHISCFKDLKHVYFREKLYNFSKYWNYQAHIYLSRELCDNLDCLNNFQCLENCQNFKSKLKYKENITPLRFNEIHLNQIITKLKYKKENIFITIAGMGIFQQNCKEMCLRAIDGLSENNIYLL